MSLDFDALFEGTLGGMSKEEAIYSLLIMAVAIDGQQDEREKAEFESLVNRSTTLRGGSADDPEGFLAGLQTKAEAWLSDPIRFNDVAMNACASLKHEGPQLCKSVFVQMVDIVLADQVLRREERDFIEFVAHQLDMEQEFIARTLMVLNAKNDF
jgi:uncharacterized tellurite resistance protein B-like protein